MSKPGLARLLAGALLFGAGLAPCAAAPLRIYAAEGVYADIAQQIGGARTAVESSNRAFAAMRGLRFSRAGVGARIALLNGSSDPVPKGVQPADALAAAHYAPRERQADDYYWYDLAAMRGLASALAGRLESEDPPGRQIYAANLARFDASLARLEATIAFVAHYYRGSDVYVADPLPRRIVQALRFRIVDPAFARGRPAPADEDALRTAIAERTASILLYDSDSKDPLIAQLVALAKNSAVPIVGVRETIPAALTYQDWMTRQINAIHGALNEAAP